MCHSWEQSMPRPNGIWLSKADIPRDENNVKQYCEQTVFGVCKPTELTSSLDTVLPSSSIVLKRRLYWASMGWSYLVNESTSDWLLAVDNVCVVLHCWRSQNLQLVKENFSVEQNGKRNQEMEYSAVLLLASWCLFWAVSHIWRNVNNGQE